MHQKSKSYYCDGFGMNKRGQYSFLYRYNIINLLGFEKQS